MDIVLDKCYLHAVSTEKTLTLCQENNLLMPEILFYELLTTTPKKRATCFCKLPDIENPVILIPNVGTLLRYEVENQIPCKPVTKVAINISDEFRINFNRDLRNKNYTLSIKEAKKVKRWNEKITNDVEEFRQSSAIAHHWFPSLEKYKPGQDATIIEDAESHIANDKELIKRIYNEIRQSHFPISDMINSQWTLFRWLQINLLAAVDYIRRFGPNNTSAKIESIENDFHDIQYCITGVQVGALASLDGRVKKFLRKCVPKVFFWRKHRELVLDR